MSITERLRSETQIPLETTDTVVQPKKVNYLNRCVEDISKKVENQHRLRSNINKTIAVATGVIFIAAVIASIVITALIAPPSIPFAALSAFCLTTTVQDFIKSRLQTSFQSRCLAEQASILRNVCDSGPSTRDEMIAALNEAGAPFTAIQDIAVQHDPLILKGVLAHYINFHAMAEDEQNNIALAERRAREHAVNYPNEAEQILALRTQVFAVKENALTAKIKASFYLAILKSPRFNKELRDVVTLESRVEGFDVASDLITLGQRFLAQQFQDETQRVLATITKSDGSKSALTQEQIESLSESDLANLILS